MNYSINLTAQDLSVIAKALQEQPYKVVFPILQNIWQQVDRQNEEIKKQNEEKDKEKEKKNK